MDKTFFQTKKIHFVGIGGHGVSALARLASVSGIKVTGSDLEESPIIEELRKLGIAVQLGHQAKNLEADVEKVIYTSAASPKDNPELVEAQKRNIPIYTYAQALGLISQERPTIAISGTNGKTTTTILLGLMLAAGGLDPLVIAGGNVAGEHGGGFRMGQGPFVVEACEAYRNFLNIHPAHLIITNIEEDHLDYYKDLEEIVGAFEKLISQTKHGGTLLLNVDDEECQKIQDTEHKKQTFGIEYSADYRATNIKSSVDSQSFLIHNSLFIIHIPGRFNIYNALAAAAMAMSLGVKPEAIQKVLDDFKGSWRRFEKLGEYRGATIISDYGHHPAGVKGTIEAARQKYPDQRIILAFHPHHKWRTRRLFDQFIDAFLDADVVILNEIWSAPGREPREDKISSKDLVKVLKKKGLTESYYGADLDETKKILDGLIKPGDVILMMGAGYIYKLAERLVKS
ncbi:MAG: UDP-N-acetylmuramate--L-alanine ligase [Patescibacteria group bacterium]